MMWQPIETDPGPKESVMEPKHCPHQWDSKMVIAERLVHPDLPLATNPDVFCRHCGVAYDDIEPGKSVKQQILAALEK